MEGLSGRRPVMAMHRQCIQPSVAYLCPMLKSPFEPCIPTKATKVPDRPEWIHEIKHDGYRLIAQRDGKPSQVRQLVLRTLPLM